jgi:hypothetical protein
MIWSWHRTVLPRCSYRREPWKPVPSVTVGERRAPGAPRRPPAASEAELDGAPSTDSVLVHRHGAGRRGGAQDGLVASTRHAPVVDRLAAPSRYSRWSPPIMNEAEAAMLAEAPSVSTCTQLALIGTVPTRVVQALGVGLPDVRPLNADAGRVELVNGANPRWLSSAVMLALTMATE